MKYFPTIDGVYLEDSYLLGVVAAGCDIHLPMLLAVLPEHPSYTGVGVGEQHCYLSGHMVLFRPLSFEWKAEIGPISRDSDGSLDFGSIELHQLGSAEYRVESKLFQVKATIQPKIISDQSFRNTNE